MGLTNGGSVTGNNSKSILTKAVTKLLTRRVTPFRTTTIKIFLRTYNKSRTGGDGKDCDMLTESLVRNVTSTVGGTGRYEWVVGRCGEMYTEVGLSTVTCGVRRVGGHVNRSKHLVTIVGASTCKRKTIPLTRVFRRAPCV